MSDSLPLDGTTRALRAMAIDQLRADGYSVSRADARYFSLLRQVHVIAKDGDSRRAAIRTSTTGWIGFRREGDSFPSLDGVDSVLHVRLHASRQFFEFNMVPVDFVLELLDMQLRAAAAQKKTPGPIIWISGDSFHADATDDDFVLPLTYPVAGVSPDDEDLAAPESLDPIPAALGMPDWMWSEILDRANRAVVSPEAIIRVILGDHFARGAQAGIALGTVELRGAV